MTTNEKKIRQLVVDTITSWEGYSKKNGKFKEILDIYNSQKKLPRGYKMTTNDAWCAATVTAIGVKLGISDALLPECSCSCMIELYKEQKRWEERDNYIPAIGDLVMYDWNDSGAGDNMGAPDHVGIVVNVDKSNIYVIEGNYSGAVKRRTIKINGRYIRGFCLPNYADVAKDYKFPVTETIKTKITPVTVDTTVPEVRNGVECDAVKILQTILTYLGFTCGDIDGSFGPKTEAAVKEYQKAVGLSVDGICGTNTWKKLILGEK